MSARTRIEDELQQTDLDFFAALLDCDVPTLEALLADDFLIVDVVSATVHSRAAFLEAISGGTLTFREIETFPYERTIRLVGIDTGIVVGRTAMSFADPEGTPLTVASRYTHVYRGDGRIWQLVSAQGTPISGSE
jgi:ketosteroid isomerase-like protein